ncbi:MAG: hypothetical protein C0483_00740 [Pirellula sp.]|nr:hypothetical protein [Pirellula sp.]
MNWFNHYFGLLPLGAVFLLTLALCIAETEVGAALARLVLRRNGAKDPDAPLGSLVGAMLGLLAFILAFTFGIATSRFDARRQLVLDEANAIGTTYLRADLLPPKEGAEIRRLLREYVDVRLNINVDNTGEVLAKSNGLHDRLWSQTKLLAQEQMDSELRSIFIVSLNEMIDLHQSRMTVGLQYRVPGVVWLALYALSSLSMLAVGYQGGMAGVRRLMGAPVLAAAFSLVILLIADIDRIGEGQIRVSQQPIADVREMMQRNSP